MATDYTNYFSKAPSNLPLNYNTKHNELGAQARSSQDIANIMSLFPGLANMLDQTNAQSIGGMSDATNQIALDQYAKYAPQFNAIGNQISADQMGQEAAMMQQYGPELMASINALQQQADPAFSQTRDSTAASIQQLLDSIDPSGALTSTQRDEINKGLLRQNQQAGTAYSPSQTNIVSNAMQYGQAGTERQAQQQSALTNAIMASNSFLPASKNASFADIYSMGTGKGAASRGMEQFQGVDRSSQQANSNILNNMFSQAATNQGIQATRDINKKTAMDKWQQGLNMGGSFIGSVAGGVAGCWVAREVYGNENPNWMIFREWLYNNAPSWFRSLYIKHGEKFAAFISNKPAIKWLIRKWMDTKI
jgi:hypothetical protein